MLVKRYKTAYHNSGVGWMIMNYFQWVNEKIKTMTCWDIGILKLCVLAFTLMIAKFWPGILGLEWYWYGLVFLVTYVYLIHKFYIKK